MPTLAERHRAATLEVRAAMLRDFLRLWPALDVARMEETFPAWLLAINTLIQRDRRQTAGLAAGYLRAARLDSGVSGAPVIQLAESAPVEQVAASMSATARAGFFTALRAGQQPEQASRTALVRSAGAASRLVLDAGRETILGSLAVDDRAAGWRRVTSGSACSFCLMLSGRGAVYSATTADFRSHDHCACGAEAVYGALRSTRRLPAAA